MSILEGAAGPAIIADGSDSAVRLGKDAAVITHDGHARYQEACYRSKGFSFCAQAALSLPAGLTNTAPVFTLYNPAGSGVDAVLWELIFAFSAAPAAATVLALVGATSASAAAPSTTTAGTIQNNLFRVNSGSACSIYTVATVSASALTVLRTLASVVAASSITPPYIKDEIGGSLIVPPGCYVILAASAAAAGFPTISWEEIPI